MGPEGVPGVDGEPGPEVCPYALCTHSFYLLLFHVIKGPPGDRGHFGPDGPIGFPVSEKIDVIFRE